MAKLPTAGAGSGVGRMQKAMACCDHPHVHNPKTHADGHKSGHKKIKRMMMKHPTSDLME